MGLFSYFHIFFIFLKRIVLAYYCPLGSIRCICDTLRFVKIFVVKPTEWVKKGSLHVVPAKDTALEEEVLLVRGWQDKSRICQWHFSYNSMFSGSKLWHYFAKFTFVYRTILVSSSMFIVFTDYWPGTGTSGPTSVITTDGVLRQPGRWQTRYMIPYILAEERVQSLCF